VVVNEFLVKVYQFPMKGNEFLAMFNQFSKVCRVSCIKGLISVIEMKELGICQGGKLRDGVMGKWGNGEMGWCPSGKFLTPSAWGVGSKWYSPRNTRKTRGKEKNL
jgi:hypothetical protein